MKKDFGGEKMMAMMKYHKIYKIVFGLLFIAVIIFLAVKIGDINNQNNNQQDTIVVSGTGKLTVKPDIATVDFSVMQENMDVSKASDAVNTQISKIVDALKADGVAEADIKTTDYEISPQYNYVNNATVIYPYGGGTQVLAGYDVTQSIEVKIRDLTKASKVVTDLGTLNVTNMSGLNFTEDKYDDLILQARDAAVVDARAQASKLAKSLGVKLVKIVGYSEGNNPTPIYNEMMAVGSVAKAPTAAVLPTGENTITSSVSITYEIQ